MRLLLDAAVQTANLGITPVATPNIWLLLKAAGELLISMRRNKEIHNDTLHHHCRVAIRRHLLKLDPHEHLFFRIPRIGLPSLLAKYLLYDTSLDENDTFQHEKNFVDVYIY